MDLSNLKGPTKRKQRKRIGRGESSGRGKTSGKGHKGQKSRSSPDVDPRFEGGQMPLQRRLPKKGFSNAPFKVRYNVVNIKELARFEAGAVITPEMLREKGLVKRRGPVKLLSQGDVSAAYTIQLERVSAAAKAKIEAAGGTVEEI
ncbi:MAG: 50S ribosomal protein L15 [Deltaproteobacteria bacterium]|nr:50S ribosomal protein L15 [Deltaproteobacteria bacterium]